MLSDSHVSEPKIIVGLHDCIIWSSSDLLFLIDWKFIVSTLSGDGLSILELFDLKVCLCIGNVQNVVSQTSQPHSSTALWKHQTAS
jgi:hypothetical protein